MKRKTRDGWPSFRAFCGSSKDSYVHMLSSPVLWLSSLCCGCTFFFSFSFSFSFPQGVYQRRYSLNYPSVQAQSGRHNLCVWKSGGLTVLTLNSSLQYFPMTAIHDIKPLVLSFPLSLQFCICFLLHPGWSGCFLALL